MRFMQLPQELQNKIMHDYLSAGYDIKEFILGVESQVDFYEVSKDSTKVPGRAILGQSFNTITNKMELFVLDEDGAYGFILSSEEE